MNTDTPIPAFDELRALRSLPAQLDINNVSPATLLLEKRRQILEVQKSLERHKQEHARKDNKFEGREQELRCKDLELQDQLVQFNKFMVDKAEKRQQYQKKTEKEIQERNSKDQEKKFKKQELKRITREREKLEKQHSGLYTYQDYLESVKTRLEEYPEIDSILKRYEVLRNAMLSLAQKERKSQTELETSRKQLHALTEKQNTATLDLNNTQQRLLRNLEQARNSTRKLETDLGKQVENASERTKDLTSICMSILNLYERSKEMFQYNKIKEDIQKRNLKEEMIYRLEIIQLHITDYRRVQIEEKALRERDPP